MPSRKTHHVLCAECRAAVTTLYVYPERRCGATAVLVKDGARVKVSCTEPPGNKDCAAGVHQDKYMFARFESAVPLRAGQQGQIGRA
jgi:hypothetical protein